MATVVSDLTFQTLGQEAIDSLKLAAAPINAFTTDFSSSVVGVNNTVRVPVIPALSADTNDNQYETSQGTTVTYADISVNKLQKISIEMTDAQADQVQVDLWKGLISEASYEVGKAALVDIMGEILAANFSTNTFTGAASAFDGDDVASIRTALNGNGVNPNNRSLVTSSSYMEGILTDTRFMDDAASGMVRSGAAGRLYGFSSYECDFIPDNSENLVGFACHPACLAVASRAVAPQSGGENIVQWGVFTDPATMLSLVLRVHYSSATGKKWATVEFRYGYETLKGAALDRMLSA